MATIVFGLSFQREATELPPHHLHSLRGDAMSPISVLGGMTTIFRTAFRAMFSEVRVFTPPGKTATNSGVSIRIRHCALFRASTADLQGREAPDFLLVAVIELQAKEPAFDAASAWQSFRTLDSKISLLGRCGLKEVVRAYSHAPGKVVGQNSFVVPDELRPDSGLLASVFAFYFLAWLTSLRIERTQLGTELAVGRKALAMTGWVIANQRLRIINLSRYFLTEDRTNDVHLKGVCNALVSKFKLRTRYERALSLHRDFEHHLDNNATIVQSQQMGSVSNLLLILTLLSVPLSFFGAIVAIDLRGDAFTAPGAILGNYKVYLIFLTGFLASLAPFAILKIRDIVRTGR